MGAPIKAKGKIIDPVKVETILVQQTVAPINLVPETTMRYQARSLVSFIQAGDHSYFVDDLSNLQPFGNPYSLQVREVDEIINLPKPPGWGNTLFQTIVIPQNICMFMKGNSSAPDQVIPINAQNIMSYVDDGEAYSYGATRSESNNYGWQPVSNNILFPHIERSDLDGFDYPEFSMRGTRKIPKDEKDGLCGPITYTGDTYNRLNYYWFFGTNAGINFNPIKSGSTPVALSGALISQEGCATISDKEGNLQFYTDGVTVYTKNNTVMTNGAGLSSSGTSTQSSLIVPQPVTGKYYIFTTDFAENPDGFEYSIVNMSLQNGLGEVEAKNIKLINGAVSEKVTACSHSDNEGYWVITHTSGDTSFYAYRLQQAGLTGPVITSIGSVHQTARGYMKTSPDGTKLISCLYDENIIDVFDFTASAGTVSNFNTITGVTYTNGPYGLEFSTDSTKFYISDGAADTISQYDLTYTSTTEMIDHMIDLPVISGASLGAIQMGPDEKIYIADLNQPYLHVIHHPNGLGVSCNLQQNDFILTGASSGITSEWGLPNVVTDHAVSCDRYVYVASRSQTNYDFVLTVNDVNDLVKEKELDFTGVIYQYDQTVKEFVTEVYSFNVDYQDINVRSASTINIPLIDIGETEFIIKGYWDHPLQTLVAKQLGYRKNTRDTYEKGELYGLYTPRTDWYFLNMFDADTPFFRNNIGAQNDISGLMVISQFTPSGKTRYSIDTNSDPIVSFNGAILFKDIEYSAITENGNPYIDLGFSPLPNQVLTMAYVRDGTTDNLYGDGYKITGTINSGPMDQQASGDKIYLDTTTGKYEYFLDVAPSSDVVFSINGDMLADGIEYLLSSSDPNRVILEVSVVIGDVIQAFYVPTAAVVGVIETNNPTIAWSILNPPTTTDGIFTVQFTSVSDKTFDNILYTASINHIVGQTSYSTPISLYNAQAGDHFIYRIENLKKYQPIMGDTIVSKVYSEIIEVEIGTNLGNNY